MKKLYLVVITLVTIGCIIGGSIYHVIGFTSSIMNNLFGAAVDFKEAYDEFEDSEEGQALHSEATTLDSFQNIAINASIAEITVKAGDTYSIQYDVSMAALTPEITVENGNLVIDQNVGTRQATIKSKNCEVIVTIPEGETLESLDANIDIGEIELRGITSEYTTIQVDIGNVELRDTTFTSLDVTVDVGEVELRECGDLSNFSFDLSCSVGEIKIDEKNHKTSYSKDGSAGSINIDTSVGDIEIR